MRRRLHARASNVRSDTHHKATTMIAKSAGRVVIEDLNVSGMMRNRRLARALGDAGMTGFLGKLLGSCCTNVSGTVPRLSRSADGSHHRGYAPVRVQEW